MVKSDSAMTTIDEFLRDSGFANQPVFLKGMERLSISPLGTTDEARRNFPIDPYFGVSYTHEPRDEDEKLFLQFKPV